MTAHYRSSSLLYKKNRCQRYSNERPISYTVSCYDVDIVQEVFSKVVSYSVYSLLVSLCADVAGIRPSGETHEERHRHEAHDEQKPYLYASNTILVSPNKSE